MGSLGKGCRKLFSANTGISKKGGGRSEIASLLKDNKSCENAATVRQKITKHVKILPKDKNL